jgi:hypothetical protein
MLRSRPVAALFAGLCSLSLASGLAAQRAPVQLTDADYQRAERILALRWPVLVPREHAHGG